MFFFGDNKFIIEVKRKFYDLHNYGLIGRSKGTLRAACYSLKFPVDKNQWVFILLKLGFSLTFCHLFFIV